MIIVKLQGGLGNQMFEYAFGRNLALKTGQVLKLDLSTYGQGGFKGDTPRIYQLDKFNICAEIATDKEIKKFKLFSSSRILKKVLQVLAGLGIHDVFGYVAERNHRQYQEIPPITKSVSYYFGWWQTEKYFKDSASVIRADFTLRQTPSQMYTDSLREISSLNSVSVHIRRGDFITNQTSLKDVGFCNPDYYVRAMEYIEKKVPDPHFFIFSDDISWTKENLPKHHKMTFVSRPGLLDQEELLLMGHCKHNILSNSTFSWWGAWFNINPVKIVIRPSRWFANPSWSFKDLVPDEWVPL